MIPYTYLIGWTLHRKFYYGVRFAKGCAPTDLWTSYFTSSKYVAEFRREFGEPDIIEIRRVFDSVSEAKDWEHAVLRRMKAPLSETFLNRTDNRCWPNNRGLKRSQAFKDMMSKIQTGKKLTTAHKEKIGASNVGKRPDSFGKAVSAGMVGMTQSRETVEKRRAKQLGQKRNAEFCEQTRRRRSIRVQGPDGTMYPSIGHAQEASGLNIKRLSLKPNSGWIRLS